MTQYPRQPLKHLAAVSVSNVDKKTVEGDHPVRLVNYTDVYYRDRITPTLPLMEATATTQQLEAFRVRPGDVAITKDSETADDIGIAAFIEESAPDLVLGYHLALLRPRRSIIDPRFLYWSMRSDLARGQLSTGATGVTRFGLRQDVIASVALPRPALATQRAIADFLDTETAHIDALIAKKRRMIDLLEKRLQAAIHRWVDGATRVPLKRLVRYQEGPGIMASDFRDEGVPLIRVAGVGGEYVALKGCNYLDPDLAADRWSHFALDEGDYLISASASMGIVSKVNSDAAGAIPYTGLIRFKPAVEDVDMEYVRYFLRSADFMSQIDQLKTGAAMQHFGPTHLDQVLVPSLSLEEQRAAVASIASIEASVLRLSSLLTHQIALLQEHRQALITAAVTGKLGVPVVAA